MAEPVKLELCDCAHPERCTIPKPPSVCRRLAGISAVNGTSNGLQLCPACLGSGVLNPHGGVVTCSACGGSGEQSPVASNGLQEAARAVFEAWRDDNTVALDVQMQNLRRALDATTPLLSGTEPTLYLCGPRVALNKGGMPHTWDWHEYDPVQRGWRPVEAWAALADSQSFAAEHGPPPIEHPERNVATDLTRLFAESLRDRHIQIKIDRHGDVYGQVCSVCNAEDGAPHRTDCDIGKACAYLRGTPLVAGTEPT